jgi:hypothetical protein
MNLVQIGMTGRKKIKMGKSILDDILIEEKNASSMGKENEVLSTLLAEINLIVDESIRSFVRSILIRNDLFWKIPSSFSGKYHPSDEHGEGGNVLHTKRVVRIAMHMSESYSLSQEEKDIVIAACLLHDVCKGVHDGESDDCRYDPMHPYTVGKFIFFCQEKDKKFASESESSTLFLSEDIVQSILRLVRCHLGPWSPIPETYPITYLDYIVHLSDNIASKIHLIIEDSDLINPKWRKDGSGTKN